MVTNTTPPPPPHPPPTPPAAYLKPLRPLQVSTTTTTKSSPPDGSSTLSSMKIKTLIHTLIVSHVCRFIRALSKAKSFLFEILKENQPIHFIIYRTKIMKRKHKNKKIFFGSFRLHYNWCSASHVIPFTEPGVDGGFPAPHLYYDSTWNSIISSERFDDVNNNNNNNAAAESQLSGYLQWLEENKNGNGDSKVYMNDIDRQADMFIASCHEKFILEKQESYRRFQEMLARSM